MSPEYISNYIGGSFVSPGNGKYFESHNPSTGKILHMIPDSEAADVDLAVAAAKSALPAWSKTSKEHRSALLNKLADLLEDNLERFGTCAKDCFLMTSFL